MAVKKGLGRGLEALLGDNTVSSGDGAAATTLRVYDVEPNAAQPRRTFEESALSELAASIAKHGLLQPVVVRKKDNGFYEIIAGERRWRASKMAGLSEIPVIIKEIDDRDAAVLAMVENLQREDLNPIEEAQGFSTLIEAYGFTQEDAAEAVGCSRANVANILRLLKLPAAVKKMVSDGRLSYGHARALLPLAQKYTEAEFEKQAEAVAQREMSVREAEKLVKQLMEEKKPAETESPVVKSYYSGLETKVSDRLGRKIKLSKDSLIIKYSGTEDLERLLKSLCGDKIFEE